MGEEYYSWRDEYRTSNGTIDAQHRELLKLANLLIDAANKGRSRAVLREAFKALFRYTEKHFEEEEAFWQSSGLPTLAEHRAMHHALKNELEQLWTDETLDFVQTTGDELTDWVDSRLIAHMTRVDRQAVDDVGQR